MKNSIYDGLKVFHRQKQDISNSDKSIDISSNSLQKLLTLILKSLSLLLYIWASSLSNMI